jgi:hypothetical protein
MTDKTIATLVVRLMGLYGIILSIIRIPGNISLLFMNPHDPTTRAIVTAELVSSVWHLLLGVGLWYWSTSLGNLLGRDVSDTHVKRECTLENLQTVAVSLFGIFVLTVAIPDLLNLIVSWLFPKANPRYTMTLGLHGETKAEIPIMDFLRVGIQLVMGFWLLLGSQGLVAWIRTVWKKARTT